MIWVFIVLDILLAIACCAAYWYREKWLCAEELYQLMLKRYEASQSENSALVEKIINHQNEIRHLKSQLENERFNKGIFEQRWKNAEEELMKTRDMLPKRDSKGRFCKKTIV